MLELDVGVGAVVGRRRGGIGGPRGGGPAGLGGPRASEQVVEGVGEPIALGLEVGHDLGPLVGRQARGPTERLLGLVEEVLEGALPGPAVGPQRLQLGLGGLAGSRGLDVELEPWWQRLTRDAGACSSVTGVHVALALLARSGHGHEHLLEPCRPVSTSAVWPRSRPVATAGADRAPARGPRSEETSWCHPIAWAPPVQHPRCGAGHSPSGGALLLTHPLERPAPRRPRSGRPDQPVASIRASARSRSAAITSSVTGTAMARTAIVSSPSSTHVSTDSGSPWVLAIVRR